MTTLQKYRQWSWLLLLIPIYLFIFLKLGSTHIRLWDEGWFTVHAIEMLQNSSWLVSYFGGEPSFTASKPPIQTWLQMGSISLFGISELSLRLPSALAAAGTVLFLFHFVKKQLDEESAWLSALILLTSAGFIGFHTARGAEADALLTLVLFGQAACYFLFLKTKKQLWLIWCGLLIGLAFLVKSMAGFLMIPGMVLFTLLFERASIMPILTSWQFYVALVSIGFVVLGYLFARDAVQPGYMDMVFRSNAGRYVSSTGHDHGILYYITNLFGGRYSWWMIIAALGVVVSLIDSSSADLYRYASIMALTFLIIISLSKSKLEWYDMPLYPLLSISAALGIQTIVKSFTPKLRLVVLVVFFIFPGINMFNRAQANTLSFTEMEYESQERFLSKAYNTDTDLSETYVVHDHFYGSLLFYKHMYAQKGVSINLKNDVAELSVGSKALVRGDRHKKEIGARFNVDTLDQYKSAVLLKMTSIKDSKSNSR